MAVPPLPAECVKDECSRAVVGKRSGRPSSRWPWYIPNGNRATMLRSVILASVVLDRSAVNNRVAENFEGLTFPANARLGLRVSASGCEQVVRIINAERAELFNAPVPRVQDEGGLGLLHQIAVGAQNQLGV